MKPRISSSLLTKFSELVADYTGLYFPKNRFYQLERALTAVYPQLGYSSEESCLEDLLSRPLTRDKVDILSQYLTIGETYFFRDKMLFQNLEQFILPILIKEREQPLKIWSAGCSTGEEPYSIAILLDKMYGNSKGVNISITATDINLVSLKKATDAVYSNWSFRAAPDWLKNKYFFAAESGRYKLCERIKERVSFSYLNLARDSFPAVNMIFCRNVLMYFVPELRRKIIQKFYHCLAPEGLLIVGPSEILQVPKEQFTTINYAGLIIYKKASVSQVSLAEKEPFQLYRGLPSTDISRFDFEFQDLASNITITEAAKLDEVNKLSEKVSKKELYEEIEALFELGKYNEIIELLQNKLAREGYTGSAKEMALLAKTYANLGELTKAEDWCNKAINQDKLDVNLHFLLATILQEQGKIASAIQSLTKTIYLKPEFLLAHFLMANLYNQLGKYQDAKKSFENALNLIDSYKAEEILPESQGITAGRLKLVIETSLKFQQ
ncbi:hypothetical protein JCM14036_08220 [Desulfotomaculum defluvii]